MLFYFTVQHQFLPDEETQRSPLYSPEQSNAEEQHPSIMQQDVLFPPEDCPSTIPPDKEWWMMDNQMEEEHNYSTQAPTSGVNSELDAFPPEDEDDFPSQLPPDEELLQLHVDIPPNTVTEEEIAVVHPPQELPEPWYAEEYDSEGEWLFSYMPMMDHSLVTPKAQQAADFFDKEDLQVVEEEEEEEQNKENIPPSTSEAVFSLNATPVTSEDEEEEVQVIPDTPMSSPLSQPIACSTPQPDIIPDTQLDDSFEPVCLQQHAQPRSPSPVSSMSPKSPYQPLVSDISDEEEDFPKPNISRRSLTPQLFSDISEDEEEGHTAVKRKLVNYSDSESDSEEFTNTPKRVKVNQIGTGDSEEEEQEEELLQFIPDDSVSDSEFPFFEVEKGDSNRFVLEARTSKSFKHKQAANETTYVVKLAEPAEDKSLSDLIVHLKALFETLLEELKSKYPADKSILRLYIEHPKLDSPIIIYPDYLSKITASDIIQQIENKIKSAGEIPADDQLVINVAICSLISGKGNNRKRTPILDRNDVVCKKSMILIQNEDNLCLPRAIVVAHSRLMWDKSKGKESEKERKKVYDKIRKSQRKNQRNEAEKLVRKAKVHSNEVGSLMSVPLYESQVGCNIVVISKKFQQEHRVYNGCSEHRDTLFLYHSEVKGKGHFDVITNMTGFSGRSYYCNSCQKAFNNKHQHSCKDHCTVCGRMGCKLESPEVCNDCNQTVRSYECFWAHQKKKLVKGYPTPSMCQKHYKCKDCSVVMKRSRKVEHKCGESFCLVCEKYYCGESHNCFMRNASPKHVPRKLIFYDFECQQQTDVHVPNLVVVQTVCDQCEGDEVDSQSKCSFCGSRCKTCGVWNTKEKEFEKYPCHTCGFRQVIFKGPNTSEEFCEWLLAKHNRDATVIAHNAKAYDNYFILDQMLSKGLAPKDIIYSGSKIMYMTVTAHQNLRFLDSVNFLPMPLSRLPKSFGLTEVKKGFFPHLFNTPENENVVLSHLPETHFYSPNTMSKGRRAEFFTWYEQHQQDTFNFQEEIQSYCVSDVDILRKACCEFRKLLRQITKEDDGTGSLDPFSFITIASVCLGVFRSKFLPESWNVLLTKDVLPNCHHGDTCKCLWHKGRVQKAGAELEVWLSGKWVPARILRIAKTCFAKTSLANLPNTNPLPADKQSIEALRWLSFEEKTRGISIQTSQSTEGEKQVKFTHQGKSRIYKLDGYALIDDKPTAFEFNGCVFHGCPSCFPQHREKTRKNNKSLAQRYRETVLKEKTLKELGFTIVTKWECDFHIQKQLNPELFPLNQIQPNITLKDCYFGGRTNALVLHKQFEPDEMGFYVDFCSLYPSILKQAKFPVGHPERITKTFKPLEHKYCPNPDNCALPNCLGTHIGLPYFGIIKATVLPPQDLLIPVLPVRINDKLKFPLCFTCAEKESKEVCSCPPEKRMFTQTYCTQELEVALNMGYKLIKIFEVLHWSETDMYNPETKKGSLFTDYINTFLKLKQQGSGFPDHVKSEEDKDKYIQEYFEHEGIQLEKDKIEKNPGLRSLAKLALNSFYGKFGQRSCMSQTKFVTDLATMYNVLLDVQKKITDIHILGPDLMMFEYTCDDKFEVDTVCGNVVIAAMCTSWARLKLWHSMVKLGERVIYHDTDSIIFTHKKGQYLPPLGCHLGDLTDELGCKELGCKGCSQGHWIVEFVSCGPKNYSYKLNTGQVVCKVRVFSLNYQNSLILNFDSMKSSLFRWHEHQPDVLTTVSTMICRNKNNTEVFNRVVNKNYGVVYDKRVVKSDLTTVPYGFVM